MAPHSSILAWKIRRSLVGCSPWGRWVVHDWATSHSRLGEGNGNPIQCSCLENPRHGGACWAAIYGVARQSQTLLKQLSSSNSSSNTLVLNQKWINNINPFFFFFILNWIFLVLSFRGFKRQQPFSHLSSISLPWSDAFFFLMPSVTKEGLSIGLTLQQLSISKSRVSLVTK